MEYEFVSRDEYEVLIKNVPADFKGFQIFPLQWEVLALEGSELLRTLASSTNNEKKYETGFVVQGWMSVKHGIWVPLKDVFETEPNYVLKPECFDARRVRRPHKTKQEGSRLVSFFFPREEVWFPSKTYYGEINKTLCVRNELGGRMEVPSNHNNNDLLLSIKVLSDEYKDEPAVSKMKLLSCELLCLYQDLYCAFPRAEVFLFDVEIDRDGVGQLKVYYPSGYKEKI